MGCGASVGREVAANGIRVEERESVATRDASGLEASQLSQALVHSHNLKDIDEVYDVNWTVAGGLGKGASGFVRPCQHKITKEWYAVKTIDTYRMEPEIVDQLFEEVAIMKILDHPNCIKVIETFINFKRLHIVMERCTGGELFDRLYEQPNARFKEAAVKDIVVKMLSALSYLHANKIIHRDLKLENFLFTRPGEEGELKLIDFGLSRAYLEGEHMQRVAGTPYYMAPELLRGDYSEAVDMWSLGVIVYMLLSGQCPFGGSTTEEITNRVIQGNYVFPKSIWSDISEEAKNFISTLLVQNVNQRASATSAYGHAWIKGTSVNETHELSEAKNAHIIQHMVEYRNYSELKRAALIAITFTLGEKEIAQMRKSFQAADKDNSGIVSNGEFVAVLKSHGIMDDEECQRIYESVDQSHSDTVTYTEYLAACIDEKQFLEDKRVIEAFHKLDLDNSGSITRENLKELFGDQCTDEAIDRILADADFSKNGVIDLDDFRKVLRGERASGQNKDHHKKPKGKRKRPSVC
jgi:calcium-dependent protein kinase